MSERLRQIVQDMRIRPDGQVLEIGCGHGVAASYVCDRLRTGHLVAIDRSKTMIEAAIRRNEKHIATGKVEFHIADVHSFDCGTRRFDKIFAVRVGLFHREPEFVRGLLEKWLAPRGRITIVYDEPQLEVSVEVPSNALRPTCEEGDLAVVAAIELDDKSHQMLSIRTEIEIAASHERVWKVLMDFPRHERWNPFVRSIEGTARVGETLKVFIQPPGGRGMKFQPKVVVVEKARELRWKGKLLIPGLFDGEHFFLLEPQPSGRVLFHQGEVFSGVLVSLMKRSLEGATKAGFIAMNEALKREAERK